MDTENMSPLGILLLLILFMMVGAGIGSGLGYLTAQLQGLDLTTIMSGFNENSPPEDRNLLRVVNLFSQIFVFALAAILTSYLIYRKNWYRYLRLNRGASLNIFSAATILIFGIFVFSQFMYWVNQQLPLPEWANSMEGEAAEMIKGILVMNSMGEFLLTLFVVAVLPAVGEELVFRGVVQQQLERVTQNPVLAIWMAAFIFSAFHLQFAGFLPRMLLGAGLGYLFLWTRSLWVPIAAHFFINGMQIAGQYIQKNALAESTVEEVNWWATALSVLLIAGLSYYLYQHYLTKVKPTEAEAPL
jgi:membrane protease YdiL (CAAX protease family)